MIDLYRSYVTQYQVEFGEFLRRFLGDHQLPILFHCAAGKDRTGFAAAILLSALNVPYETIIADYILTNDYYRRDPSRFAHLPSPELFHTVMSADPDYLRASFAVIDDKFGGVHAYLRSGLGLSDQDVEALQANLLE